MKPDSLPLSRSPAHWLALAGLVVFWGSSFAMTKVAVGTIPPAWVVCIRMWVALAILLVVVLWRGEGLPRGARNWLWYAWLGAIGNNIPFMLISWGTLYIDSGLAGILMATVPLMVISMAHFVIPGERMSRRKALGFLLGFAGIIVLIGPGALSNINHTGIALLAQFAILGATICYATHSITARFLPRQSIYQTTLGVMTTAALFSIPTALIMNPEMMPGASMVSLAATIGLGIFPTAMAGLLLFWLISTAGPSFVSLSNYLIPPFAVFTGVAALGERPEWTAMAGLGFILLGIWLGQKLPGAKTEPARQDGSGP